MCGRGLRMVRCTVTVCVSRSESCRSDYNFIPQDGKCVPAGPEPIPEGVCAANDPKQTFMGSSGYRRIPGNTCDYDTGKKKDEKVEKSCSQGTLLGFNLARVLILASLSTASGGRSYPSNGTCVLHNEHMNTDSCPVRVPVSNAAVRLFQEFEGRHI